MIMGNPGWNINQHLPQQYHLSREMDPLDYSTGPYLPATVGLLLTIVSRSKARNPRALPGLLLELQAWLGNIRPVRITATMLDRARVPYGYQKELISLIQPDLNCDFRMIDAEDAKMQELWERDQILDDPRPAQPRD